MKSYRTGVLHHDPDRTSVGFTVIAPMRHEASYLIDMDGNVAHRWQLPGPLGSKGHVIPNGNFLCSVVTPDGTPIPGALGGHLLELDWDGKIVWEHIDHNQHHDIVRLDNGNTAYLAREELSPDDAARVQGGLPGTEIDGKIHGDIIREVDPAGELVWEWYFASVDLDAFPLAPDCHRGEWAHANSLAPTLDGNYLVSFRHVDTILIVDRATGEVTWSRRDPTWGHQHDANMLPNGNITLFANGMSNIHQPLHSRALEIDPSTGEIVWEYIDPKRWTFFSPVMGGVQRLPNGNTLLCESLNGRVFEVTNDGDLVWDYICPFEHPNPVLRAPANALFRAYRYTADSAEIAGRVHR